MRHFLPLCQSALADDRKLALLDMLADAHDRAALTNTNASSVAVQLAAIGSADFGKAITAAVSMLGAAHGPITAARVRIYGFNGDWIAALDRGERMPGWGNSFHKDGIDPSWGPFADYLKAEYPQGSQRLDEITETLAARLKRTLYPNAAAFTAVSAQLLGVPYGVEAALFVASRLPAWALMFAAAR